MINEFSLIKLIILILLVYLNTADLDILPLVTIRLSPIMSIGP